MIMNLFRKKKPGPDTAPFRHEEVAAFREVQRVHSSGVPLAEALSDQNVDSRAFFVWKSLEEDEDAVLKAARDLS